MTAQARRQGPDTAGVSLGIQRVAIEKALCLQHEAGPGRGADDVIPAHVAYVARTPVLLRVRHVLDYAQLATGLEDVVKMGEGCHIDAVGDHAVGVAESDHAVDAAGLRGADGEGTLLLIEHQRRDFDLAVDAFIFSQLLFEFLPGSRAVAGLCIAAVVVGGDQLALVAQVGCQYLRIPAAAGPDLYHGLAGLNIEELQCLQGVPVAVALDVSRRSVLAGNRLLEFSRVGLRGQRQGCRGRHCGQID